MPPGRGPGRAAAASDPVASGPGTITVEVGIDQSRFDMADLRVVEGTLVEFVVGNDDPIDHELVVGDAAVHARHAEGSERRHPPVPGEVSGTEPGVPGAGAGANGGGLAWEKLGGPSSLQLAPGSG